MGRLEQWVAIALVVAAILAHGAMGRFTAVVDAGRVVVVDGLTGERRICYSSLTVAAQLAKPHTVDTQNCISPGDTVLD